MDTILDREYNNIMVGGAVVKLYRTHIPIEFGASLIY